MKLAETEVTLEKRVWRTPTVREKEAATDCSRVKNEGEVRLEVRDQEYTFDVSGSVVCHSVIRA